MSTTSHLLPLHQKVTFVRAQEDPYLDSSQPQPSTSTDPLSGEEAYNFYLEVLSTSEKKDAKKVKTDESPRSKKIKTKEPGSQQSSTVQTAHSSTSSQQRTIISIPEEEPLSDRDNRLFLRAASENNLKVVTRYHTRGIDLETTDMYGWTALLCAAAARAYDVVEYLVEVGVNVNHTDKSGKTAVDYAKANRYNELVEYLESAGYVFLNRNFV